MYIFVEINIEMYLNIISILIYFFKILSDLYIRFLVLGISLLCIKGKIFEFV